MPFAVISSAVAIPSATGLAQQPREFVVYESSLSDILGVLVFYAWLGSGGSLGAFAADLLGGVAISAAAAVAAALGLYVLINKLEGHVRFLPMLAGIVCLYAIGKELHLSPLVLVLVCGLLLNNTHVLRRLPRVNAIRHPEYEQTLKEFKGLVAELTFATKSFFFLLLGYWTDVREMAVARGVVARRRHGRDHLRDALGAAPAAAPARRRPAGLDRAARPHHRAAVPGRLRDRHARPLSRSAR